MAQETRKQVAAAHAQFLSLGLHCECGQAKQKDEACCRGCAPIHAAGECFDCRAGRERHLAHLADQVAQTAAERAPKAASVLAALDAATAPRVPPCPQRSPVTVVPRPVCARPVYLTPFQADYLRRLARGW